MNFENLIRMLMKIMGVTDQQMRETFEKGQALIIDGSNRIATMDARLARIEAALGIPAEPASPAPKELTHDEC